MEGDDYFSRSRLMGAAIFTLVLAGIGGLGVYAVVQGIVERRFVHFAQAFVPLLIATIGLRVLFGYWMAFFRRGDRAGKGRD